VWQTGEVRLGLLTAGGFIAALVLFSLLAWMILRAWRWTRAPLHWPAWRFAQDSLRRRPAASVLQIVSLALGLMALLLLTIVRHDLLAAWQQSAPPDAPNHFMINIQPEQRAPIVTALQADGIRNAPLYPMIRGRLVQVNGKQIGPESYTEERAQRLVEREFNLSTMPDLPAHNSVVEGRWFGPKVSHEASVEQGLANTLQVRLGDTLRFEVAGISVDAKVTSIRKLDWGSMRVNFFVILDPASAQTLKIVLQGRDCAFHSAFGVLDIKCRHGLVVRYDGADSGASKHLGQAPGLTNIENDNGNIAVAHHRYGRRIHHF
jgi:putative ABC transport system permease protein